MWETASTTRPPAVAGDAHDRAGSAPAWLRGLNERQAAAVTHDGGPLLVVAGAGSGKTRTLASRVARLIDVGVPAERILLLTFTRRAAAEMLQRAAALVGGRSTDRVVGGTFHSVANRFLRRFGGAVGLRDGFTVIDQSDAFDLIGAVRGDLDYGSGPVRFPKQETIGAAYSRMVNAQEPLDAVIDRHFPWCGEHRDGFRAIMHGYRKQKIELAVLDYDDLLLYWRALLEAPAAGGVRAEFDHVLVDEYQDTNAVQADILELMAADHGNITVVGDDAQAIYGFRAASARNMVEFPGRFPGTTIVKLEQNYRSTPSILAAANAVMEEASDVHAKRLWSSRPDGPRPALVTCMDEATQSTHVCDTVLELREDGLELRDQAVLFRTGHHSDGLELELARRDIPYVKFGGLRFLDAAHVKDLLALLRMLDNPRDDLAWRRVLLALPGVGPATARKLLDHLSRRGPDRRVADFIEHGLPVPASAADEAGELRAAIADCVALEEGALGPGAQIERLRAFCARIFERAYDDAAARLVDIEQLGAAAAAYPDRSRFLTELILDPPSGTSDLAGPPHLDDDYLTLSTIHSAKGGEWRAVFVIHAADGNIPSDMALGEPDGLEEERRLFYVALTRAKDHLEVTVPQRFYHRRYGADAAHHYAPPSRFLSRTAAHFDTRTAGGSEQRDVPSIQAASGVDPVGSLLDALLE